MCLSQSHNPLTVIGPELPRLVHVLADHFDVENRFSIALYVVKAQPAAYARVWQHPLHHDVIEIVLLLKESHLLRFRCLAIDMHQAIIFTFKEKRAALRCCKSVYRRQAH